MSHLKYILAHWMFVRRRCKHFHTPFVYRNDVGELYFTTSISGHRISSVSLTATACMCGEKYYLFFTFAAVFHGNLWNVPFFLSTITVDTDKERCQSCQLPGAGQRRESSPKVWTYSPRESTGQYEGKFTYFSLELYF